MPILKVSSPSTLQLIQSIDLASFLISFKAALVDDFFCFFSISLTQELQVFYGISLSLCTLISTARVVFHRNIIWGMIRPFQIWIRNRKFLATTSVDRLRHGRTRIFCFLISNFTKCSVWLFCLMRRLESIMYKNLPFFLDLVGLVFVELDGNRLVWSAWRDADSLALLASCWINKM